MLGGLESMCQRRAGLQGYVPWGLIVGYGQMQPLSLDMVLFPQRLKTSIHMKWENQKQKHTMEEKIKESFPF